MVFLSPPKVSLVEKILDALFVDDAPEKLIGDKAYDRDPLDEPLEKQRGIELVTPHKANRRKSPTQDERRYQLIKIR